MAVVLSGPWIGELRSWIRRTFPGEYRLIINGASLVFIAAGVAIVLARIRDRRLLRYSLLAAAFALASGYLAIWAPANPDVAAVERFHFVEYGLVTFLFNRAFQDTEASVSGRVTTSSVVILAALATFAAGIADEWLQWFVPERVGELNDIFLNSVAIACGLLVSIGAQPPRGFTWSMPSSSLARVGWMLAAVLLTLAAFVHVIHIGYLIQDDEVGAFRSRYGKAELTALARDRATTWSTHPPPLTLVRFSREDQYLHEATWHVQSRNEFWGRGDAASAWSENRILEKYYEPALDTPSYISRIGHRWPPAQRADAAARGATLQRSYMSHADTPTLFIWSKTVFWAIVGTITLGIVALTRRRT